MLEILAPTGLVEQVELLAQKEILVRQVMQAMQARMELQVPVVLAVLAAVVVLVRRGLLAPAPAAQEVILVLVLPVMPEEHILSAVPAAPAAPEELQEAELEVTAVVGYIATVSDFKLEAAVAEAVAAGGLPVVQVTQAEQA